MVRTAGTSIKTTGGKSAKGASVSRGASYSSGSSRKTIGGNKLKVQPIPQWQKSISAFCQQPAEKTIEINPDGFVIVESEEEIVPLEAPDWQQPVTDFFECENKAGGSQMDLEEDFPFTSSSSSGVLQEIYEQNSKKKKFGYLNEDCDSEERYRNPKKRSKIDYAQLESLELKASKV